MPMPPPMTMQVLSDALRLARASWTGQLLLLAVGAVLLGVTMHGASSGEHLPLRILVGSAELVVLLGAAARLAIRSSDGRPSSAVALTAELAPLAPRLVVQVATCAAPAVVVTWLALWTASLHPLLGLAGIPLALLAVIMVQAPLLLAAAAVVHGDPAWLPRSTWLLLRGRAWHLAGLTMVGIAGTCALALPLVVVGVVLAAVLGPLGLLGSGLALVAAVPWLGCGAVAAWRATGGDDAVPDTEDASTEPTAIAWMDGPAWDVAIAAGSNWGTWIRIEAAATVGIRVTWSDGPAPALALASEAGTWTSPGDPVASGSIVPVALPAGSTYIQLGARSATPQQCALALLVPPAATAA